MTPISPAKVNGKGYHYLCDTLIYYNIMEMAFKRRAIVKDGPIIMVMIITLYNDSRPLTHPLIMIHTRACVVIGAYSRLIVRHEILGFDPQKERGEIRGKNDHQFYRVSRRVDTH